MSNFDLWFAGIARFSLIAFVLLGACLWAVRVMRQPLERVRLIQTSLLALSVTLALAVADVVPTVDLAWLPAESPHMTEPPEETHAAAQEAQPQQSQPANPAFETNKFATTEIDDSASASENHSAGPAATNETSNASSTAFALLPFLKNTFTVAFLLGSLLNLVHLAIGFIATRRLVNRSTPLTA
ncbi:MAG: hypothetical protein MI861_28460, partial [Pirellulales bacterium]|nr:hypothetical protein [Pirellulales bacterium]